MCVVLAVPCGCRTMRQCVCQCMHCAMPPMPPWHGLHARTHALHACTHAHTHRAYMHARMAHTPCARARTRAPHGPSLPRHRHASRTAHSAQRTARTHFMHAWARHGHSTGTAQAQHGHGMARARPGMARHRRTHVCARWWGWEDDMCAHNISIGSRCCTSSTHTSLRRRLWTRFAASTTL